MSFLNLFNKNDSPFKNKSNKKFVIHLFEAVFVAICEQPFKEQKLVTVKIPIEKIITLANDREFNELSQGGTTRVSNVRNRINRARKILGTL